MIAETVLRVWVAAYTVTALFAAARAAVRSGTAGDAGRDDATAGGERDAWAAETVLVRPLAGDEAGLEERLVRTGGADCAIFAIGHATDSASAPAHRAATRLQARGVDARVVVTNASLPNHKADQLARALETPRARARKIVVVADSDVDLGDDAVARLLRSLGRSHAVWAPPVERGRILTWGDRACHAILDASLHSFPLLSAIDAGGFVGKLFAVRRGALDAVGGFGAVTRSLGEDTELARLLRESGRETTVAPFAAHAMAEGRRLGDVIARFARWVMVVRAQRPHLLATYPLLIAASPVLAALAIVGVIRHDSPFAVLAASGLVVRMGIACMARVRAGLSAAPHRAAFDAFFGDAVLLVAWLIACCTNRVTWRGRQLRVTRGGLVTGGEHTHEHALGDAREEAGAPVHHGFEARRGARPVKTTRLGRQRFVDPPQLAFDAGALEHDTIRHVAFDFERLAERHPQVRPLVATERIPKANGHDDRSLRDARDEGRAGSQFERSERRTLPAFGEDPEGAPRATEELRGMANASRAVGRHVEIDAERADSAEERQTAQVRGIHHRVPVAREQELGGVERDERVPPRRMVGNQEDRPGFHRLSNAAEPADEDTPERAPDPRARVTREPVVEPPALLRRDHGASS